MCENPRMRIGVSLRSTYSSEPRTGARWMIERARAHDAGLDSLFVGDHHSTGPGAYYQNVPILGRLLAEWAERQRLRGGTASGRVVPAPPVEPGAPRRADRHAGLDRGGRFIMQTAIGGGAEQFAGMGTTLRGRAARFEQGLEIVRRLLAGDRDRAYGDVEIRDAHVAPLTPEPLEVWIGGSAEVAIDRAARLGDGWLANANHTLAEARTQAGFYLDRCAELGKTPTAVAIRRDVHVGASAQDAARVAEPVIAAGYRGFPPEACTYGDAEQVAESLRAFADAGFTDIIVRQLADDQADALASTERLAAVRALLAG